MPVRSKEPCALHELARVVACRWTDTFVPSHGLFSLSPWRQRHDELPKENCISL